MRTRQRAFTITELIVVIAVLALLAGLLAPGLVAARTLARRTECQSHLRQMTVAAANYAATYDRYPVAIRYEVEDGRFLQIAWDWVTTFDGTLVSPGPLWMFTNNPLSVQRCPSYDGPANFSGAIRDPRLGGGPPRRPAARMPPEHDLRDVRLRRMGGRCEQVHAGTARPRVAVAGNHLRRRTGVPARRLDGCRVRGRPRRRRGTPVRRPTRH
ncbi:MAG: type II secretion system protein [Planctomycetota bacterium]